MKYPDARLAQLVAGAQLLAAAWIRVQGSGFRVQGLQLEWTIWGSGLKVHNLGFRV